MSKWTTEKPKEAGFCWIRYVDKSETLAVLYPTRSNGLLANFHGTSSNKYLDEFDPRTQWQGPIFPEG